MNLLKGITEELKGSGESNRASDRDQSRTTPGRTHDRRETASTAAASERTGDRGANGDARASEDARDDEHVCAFCATDFDASRGACPDCGAEIIVRGER